MSFVPRLIHSLFCQKIIGWGFAHMSFALPVHKLYETRTLVAFDHPKPCYPVHILLVPKKSVSSLMELNQEDTLFLSDLIQATQELVRRCNLEQTGYRLIVNGGNCQDIKQLHFHLISGEEKQNKT